MARRQVAAEILRGRLVKTLGNFSPRLRFYAQSNATRLSDARTPPNPLGGTQSKATRVASSAAEGRLLKWNATSLW